MKVTDIHKAKDLLEKIEELESYQKWRFDTIQIDITSGTKRSGQRGLPSDFDRDPFITEKFDEIVSYLKKAIPMKAEELRNKLNEL